MTAKVRKVLKGKHMISDRFMGRKWKRDSGGADDEHVESNGFFEKRTNNENEVQTLEVYSLIRPCHEDNTTLSECGTTVSTNWPVTTLI